MAEEVVSARGQFCLLNTYLSRVYEESVPPISFNEESQLLQHCINLKIVCPWSDAIFIELILGTYHTR